MARRRNRSRQTWAEMMPKFDATPVESGISMPDNQASPSEEAVPDKGEADHPLYDPELPDDAPEAPAAVPPDKALGPRDAPTAEPGELSAPAEALDDVSESDGEPLASGGELDKIIAASQMLELALTSWLVRAIRGRLYQDDGVFSGKLVLQPALYWGDATKVEVDSRAAMLALALATCGQLWMPGLLKKAHHPVAILGYAMTRVFMP